MFVLLLSGKGSLSCLERGRRSGLLAAHSYPFDSKCPIPRPLPPPPREEMLTITTFLAISTDDKVIVVFLFFLESRLRYIIQQRRQFAWNAKTYFLGETSKKIFQIVVCWIFYPACWALSKPKNQKRYLSHNANNEVSNELDNPRSLLKTSLFAYRIVAYCRVVLTDRKVTNQTVRTDLHFRRLQIRG